MITSSELHWENRMIRETKTSNLMNDYFGYYTKNWERSNWKIEWRRKRKLKVSEGSCRSCLHCFIVVVLDFDQRLMGTRIKRITKRDWQISDILISRGRNLQGRNGKGPKPLGVKSEKGRNLWQPAGAWRPMLFTRRSCTKRKNSIYTTVV